MTAVLRAVNGSKRLPTAPLLATLHVTARRCAIDIAEQLEMPFDRIEGWLRRGLSIDQADKLACLFGYHPSEIWSEWWDE